LYDNFNREKQNYLLGVCLVSTETTAVVTVRGAYLTEAKSLFRAGTAIFCTDWRILKWGWVYLLQVARLYGASCTVSTTWIPAWTCGNFQWERSSNLAATPSDRL